MTQGVPMRITPALPSDHPQILEVWEDSVRATHDFLSEQDILDLKPQVRNLYLPAVDLYCLKDKAGNLHGFLGISGQDVEMLFLASSSRGKGLGRMLLQYAVSALGAVRVDVNEQNPKALGFYEHMGFAVQGRSPRDAQGRPFPILHLQRNAD